MENVEHEKNLPVNSFSVLLKELAEQRRAILSQAWELGSNEHPYDRRMIELGKIDALILAIVDKITKPNT